MVFFTFRLKKYIISKLNNFKKYQVQLSNACKLIKIILKGDPSRWWLFETPNTSINALLQYSTVSGKKLGEIKDSVPSKNC